MKWLNELFFGVGIGHTIMLIALVIALGIALGKLIRIKGITLGVTWILFVGILMSHFGMRVEAHTLHFIKEFGLILFIFSIGLQVGPSFFATLKKGGMTMNLLASSIVLLGIVTTFVIHLVTGVSITTMVGIMSGAVTNTPGLGAAQQTFLDINNDVGDPTIAQGYAVAYPLGVLGIIGTIMIIKFLFKIKLDKEPATGNENSKNKVLQRLSVEITNKAIDNKSIKDIVRLIDKSFVISRICREDGSVEIATPQTVLKYRDKLFIISNENEEESLVTFFGTKLDMSFEAWVSLDDQLLARKVVITKSHINGQSIAQLKLRNRFGINVTRVSRAGIDLIPHGDLELLMGDRLTIVGKEEAIIKAAEELGNSVKKLREPNLIPIFIGMFLGVVLGSVPIFFPGIPQPIKLGLAGGPLIISILIAKWGPKYKLVTYTTLSANLMLREVGISLFLAAVGIGAGEGFVDTVTGGGYVWILYGVLITIIPIFIVGVICRLILKMNYFTLSGLIAGSMTDPPALAYANSMAGNNLPSVGYATVYPLTMFMRIISAQLLILFL